VTAQLSVYPRLYAKVRWFSIFILKTLRRAVLEKLKLTDSIDSHQRFKKACALSFQLATDPEGKVQETYGVRRRFPRQSTMRVTFLIDQAAVIRGAYQHEVAVRRHVADVLHDLEQMDKKNR
jgi:alkyl hydroperoxide reductase subunit AhpC